MRCQPGDLAIFLPEPIGECNRAARGLIVTVKEHHFAFGEVHWSLSNGRLQCPNCGLWLMFLPDADPQPLRPGPSRETTNDSQDIRDGVAHA